MLNQISTLRIFVTDMKKAVSFYRDTLGMELDFSSDNYVQFNTLGAKLAIEYIDPGNEKEVKEHVGRFIGVSFSVPNIGEAYDILSARGVRFTGPPQIMSWGGRLTHFYDEDSNCLSLVQH